MSADRAMIRTPNDADRPTHVIRCDPSHPLDVLIPAVMEKLQRIDESRPKERDHRGLIVLVRTEAGER